MKFLHFATEDVRGGAAQATYQLHLMLIGEGHDSRMLVRRKYGHDSTVSIIPASAARYRWNALKRRLPFCRPRLPAASYHFNFDRDPQLSDKAFFQTDPSQVDVICLHWIDDLLTVKRIHQICNWYGKPILWTLTDREPITGGCHYPFDCKGYTRQCGHCPQLTPRGGKDFSHELWQRKRRWLSGLPIAFACSTEASVARIGSSSLFGEHRAFATPWGVDETIFRPFSKMAARDLLHLPADKRIVFFGASMLDDRRKGTGLFIEALNRLPGLLRDARGPVSPSDVFVAVAGLNAEEFLDKQPFPYRYLGLLRDDLSLALAYQAADTFVSASIQDEGPMMVPQSAMCGTPVVAFDTGYASDLLRSGEAGQLCGNRNAESLAQGIHAVLSSSSADTGQRVREIAARRHSQMAFMKRYTEVCEQLVETHSRSAKDAD